ncbi:hypothetical protein NMY22_g6258 [Coprinellus aureogranulatus]|nr:hypothetical protein NMY22_g6258 [Coprinellus aureogranulatus]
MPFSFKLVPIVSQGLRYNWLNQGCRRSFFFFPFFFNPQWAWRAGSSADDKNAEKYSDSSFMVTQAQGASFSFMYYGTEVSIFGSKRIGHGAYQVSLDGVMSAMQSGDATPDVFNSTLYTGSASKGLHNVTLINRENRFLDVDMVSWTASVGEDNEPLIVNTWQDTHPNFKYSPSDAWTLTPPNVGAFSAGSGHGRYCPGNVQRLDRTPSRRSLTDGLTDLVPLTIGDAIALYGPAGPNSAASYSVQVDDQAPSRYSAVKQFERSRQLLYYGGNFGKGTHTLTLKLDSVSAQSQVLAVDYAEVYTAPSLGGRLDSASSAPVGLIVGIAILSILVTLALGLLTYIYYLYKNGRLDLKKSKVAELEYPDMQTFQSATVEYQPTITSPLSTYPGGVVNRRYSPTYPMYPESGISPTITSAGTAPPSAYYDRPPLQRAPTDVRSTVSEGGTSDTHYSRTSAPGLNPSRSIRKYRLQPQDEVEHPTVTSPPPPAYLASANP